MPYKYFQMPFAVDGEKTTVPDDTQENGAVSYEQGFGPDYSKAYLSDPNAKAVPRLQTNQLYNDITTAIQHYQQITYPNFITEDDNGGTPFSYARNAAVLYPPDASNAVVFQSLANSNTALPTDTSKWRRLDGYALGGEIINVTFAPSVLNGDLVYYDSANSRYDQALADGTAKQWVVGIAEPANKRVLTSGHLSYFSGLTAGSVYYLSSTTPGAVSTTTSVVQIGVATAASTINVSLQLNSAALFSGSTVVNGYQRFPNGLILQWGRVTMLASGTNTGEVTATFPIAFPTQIFEIFTTIASPPRADWEPFTTYAPDGARTLSNCEIDGDTTDTGVAMSLNVIIEFFVLGN